MTRINDVMYNHLGNAFIFMTRYALSRDTSADMATLSALKSWIDDIPSEHLTIIKEEILFEKDIETSNNFIWKDIVELIERNI